jgi:hypothetical protein
MDYKFGDIVRWKPVVSPSAVHERLMVVYVDEDPLYSGHMVWTVPVHVDPSELLELDRVPDLCEADALEPYER